MMRRSLLGLMAAVGLALMPAAVHADAAYDTLVQAGPYSGTFTAQPRWVVGPNEPLPSGCFFRRGTGELVLNEGAAAQNGYGDYQRCTFDRTQR